MAITIIRSIIIYFFVVLAVRIMGRRQIGELSTHEFVITILISSVATIPLQDVEIPLTNSLLPILILISLEIIQSSISMKSKKFRELFEGKPIFVIKDGRLKQNEMSRLRLTMSDILDNLRQQQIFDITQVKNAVFEANGKMSVQKTDDKSGFLIPIVTDGEKCPQYFGKDKFSEEEIDGILKKASCAEKELMLLTVDGEGKIFLIKKENSDKREEKR